MAKENLISSKVLIGELFADYNIEGTNWLGSINRHIARGMELMQLHGYFVRKFEVKKVEDYKTSLPCDNKNIIGVVISNGKDIRRLPIENTFYSGIILNGISLVEGIEARLDYNYLILNGINNINVGFLYYAIPLDEEGFPMIIDNPFVLEALPMFILSKLSLNGYKHPVITREEAEAKWRIMSPRARNAVNFPTIEEMERITISNTNPFYEYTPGKVLEHLIESGTSIDELYLNNNIG